MAIVLALLGLGGCAGSGTRPGEPSPKESAPVAETSAAPETIPTGSAAPAPVAAPLPPLVLSDKPRIIAKVEWTQFPVWVERGGIKAAVKAGWAIYTGDKLTTGADGRMLLATVGEGQLKMGGNSAIDVTVAYEPTGGPEPSLLKVRRGTVSLTAPMTKTGVPGLLVDIDDGITANVLGGQVVLKADPDEDLLAVMDGAVEISGPKLNPGTMKAPGTYLRVPHAGRAQTVSEVGQDKVARWLSQAEPVNGRPMLDAAGTWDVSLNSGYNLQQLETMACHIQNRGYPTEIYPVREPGKQVWYRVVVRRFKSRNDAIDFIGTAKALGAKEPWVLIPAT